MYSYRQLFLNHVAQTSPAPLALEFTKGRGVWLTDIRKKRYIDFISGIGVSSIGHAHPAVVNAVQKQVRKYAHLMVYGEYVQSPQVRLAHKLAELLPPSLSSVYFVNSGAEAVEAAMKLAKRATGRSQVLSMKNAYHGSSQGALSIMGDEYFKTSFRPLLPDTGIIRFNDTEDLKQITPRTAAVFAETIQGEAGAVAPDAEWLKALRARCTETGALLVLDEIQAGVGRTGTLWAFEAYGVIPDILLLAKGIGGGMPIGLMIASQELTGLFTHNPVLGHISTFGGNAVCAAAALATLKVITEEKLYESVPEKEEMVRRFFRERNIPVSGKGLLLAAHFNDEDTNFKVIEKSIQNGLITDWFLFNSKALRMAPPLTISAREMGTALRRLEKSLPETGL
ncbi:MAG: aspartate aminotransferase family protein [Bacteroidia bacterium]|nr:aspartate aminotransferase family protein [Bacteroidia bacterium]